VLDWAPPQATSVKAINVLVNRDTGAGYPTLARNVARFQGARCAWQDAGVPNDLAPGLLIASPGMNCPFFSYTVVLLVEHSEDGALGFVINRPTDTPVTSLLEGLEVEDLGEHLPGEVWVGGPVAPDTGWVLFDPTSGNTEEVEAVELCPRLAVSASHTFLEHIAAGRGPSQYALLLGYAGWGPGQLDDEIRSGSWIPIDLDAALVFDAAPEDCWREGLATLGIDPARVVGIAGGVAEA